VRSVLNRAPRRGQPNQSSPQTHSSYARAVAMPRSSNAAALDQAVEAGGMSAADLHRDDLEDCVPDCEDRNPKRREVMATQAGGRPLSDRRLDSLPSRHRRAAGGGPDLISRQCTESASRPGAPGPATKDRTLSRWRCRARLMPTQYVACSSRRRTSVLRLGAANQRPSHWREPLAGGKPPHGLCAYSDRYAWQTPD
jgi:hypothetical protein